MSSATAIIRARARAEAEMEGRVIIRGEPTRGPFNEDTGEVTIIPGEVQYAGKFKLQTFAPYETKPESGQHVYVIQRYAIHIPVGPKVLAGATAVIEASASDPRNVGRRFTVAAPFGKSYATAQRVNVDEIVG